MAFSRQCDRCKQHFPADQVVQLDSFSSLLGHYYTRHLCKAECHKAFEHQFMRGKAVEARGVVDNGHQTPWR